MPRTPCCCGCIVCQRGGSAVLQSNMSATNNGCDGVPGCASLDGDKVMVPGSRGDTSWAYAPDILPFDETKVCVWGYTDANITCEVSACETCACYGTFDDQGMACDPDVGPFCTDSGAAVNSNEDCTTCGNVGCGPNCNLVGAPPKCTCVSDGLGGYVCSCNDACECEYECAPMTASRRVWLYLSDDETEIVMYTEVVIGPEVLTGYTTFPATDGKIDCLDDLGSATITLTSQNPGAQGYCNVPTTITYEFI